MPTRVERLGGLFPVPGYCDELMIFFEATDLRPPPPDSTRHQDEDERIETRLVTLDEARASGVVKTLFGRRRLVPELTSKNTQVRMAAERVAVNMPIQGTAADILKRAMIDLHGTLVARGSKTRMILTVHDELLFESPRDEADAAVQIVRERMEGAAALAVPLTVDVGVGENWRDAKP